MVDSLLQLVLRGGLFYLGDCQNYGPFLGPYYNTLPNTGPNLGDPKRDYNFDNPPFVGFRVLGVRFQFPSGLVTGKYSEVPR